MNIERIHIRISIETNADLSLLKILFMYTVNINL